MSKYFSGASISVALHRVLGMPLVSPWITLGSPGTTFGDTRINNTGPQRTKSTLLKYYSGIVLDLQKNGKDQ